MDVFMKNITNYYFPTFTESRNIINALRTNKCVYSVRLKSLYLLFSGKKELLT